MKNEKAHNQTGSAWNFLFVLAGLFILLFLLPLIAFNVNVSDKVDIWTNNPLNQSRIILALVVVGLIAGIYWVVKKVS